MVQPLINTCVGYWTRGYVQNHPEILFIFTDNIDRTSGNNPIDENSWYYKKYSNGKPLYYPGTTSACIRGLENAYPISVQKHYNASVPAMGNWQDSDYKEFNDVIADELNDIVNAYNEGYYTGIMYPTGGLFCGLIANLSYERVPLLRVIAEMELRSMELEILESCKIILLKKYS